MQILTRDYKRNLIMIKSKQLPVYQFLDDRAYATFVASVVVDVCLSVRNLLWLNGAS